jgi:hypothetical protein
MLCEAKTYNINVFLEEEWPHIFDQESAVLGRFLTPHVWSERPLLNSKARAKTKNLLPS